MGSTTPSFSSGKSSREIQDFAELGQEFTYEEHGFISTSLVLGSDQLGTALEVPAKWNELGATLTDIPGSMAVRPVFVIGEERRGAKRRAEKLCLRDIDVRAGKERSNNAADSAIVFNTAVVAFSSLSLSRRSLFLVADVTHEATEDPGYELQVSDITAFEKAHLTTISVGSVVAIRTDFSKSYLSYVTDGLPSTFPSISLQVRPRRQVKRGARNDRGISRVGRRCVRTNRRGMLMSQLVASLVANAVAFLSQALEFLHNTRKVLMVGYEPFSVDSSASQTGAAWLAHKNRSHLKGLTNLDRVLAKVSEAKPAVRKA